MTKKTPDSSDKPKTYRRTRHPKNQLLDLKTIDWKVYYWDEEKASRIIDFAKRYIRHVKGKSGGKAFEFSLWQERILRTFFGWIRISDDCRRFRTLYIEVPRKNGKSFIASIVALYLLFADKEAGAEIYSAATDERQARIVFRSAVAMLNKAPKLRKRCKVTKKAIEKIPFDDSFYTPLSAEAYTKDGLNASGIIFDELHAQPTRDLYDVLRTSQGAREQPVELNITTAGKSLTGIGYDVHLYAEKVRDGVVEDPAFLPVIYAIKDGEDWKDLKVIKRCNPGYGISVKPDFLESELRRAINEPSYAPTFQRLYLNKWVGSGSAWMSADFWKGLAEDYTWADLLGMPCWLALDLSKRTDLSAATLFFPTQDLKGGKSLTKFWMPSDRLEDKEKDDRAPYQRWVDQGLITLTDGDVIDLDFIVEEVQQLYQDYDIKEGVIDPWSSTAVTTRLQKEEIELIEFRQGWKSMSPAMKDLEAMFRSRKYAHDGNPVMSWMMSNLKVKTDDKENMQPDKRSSTSRIDGPVSLIMAGGRAFAAVNDPDNIYDTEGFIQL